MPTTIEMPPRIFDSDARPTMLYDIGLSEEEALWVVRASPQVMPGNPLIGPTIDVKYSDDDPPSRDGPFPAFYDRDRHVINCGPRAQNMGTVLHELAHSSGHSHMVRSDDTVPTVSELEANRPFRAVHTTLLDYWEELLAVDQVEEPQCDERTSGQTAELERAIAELDRMMASSPLED